MTDMILERIKQVRSGHIPQGYTRTKAGIMPKDWNLTVQAKQLFKSYTNKKHTGDLEILAATQESGMIPRSQIGKEIKSSEEGIAGYKIVKKGDFVISLRSFQGGIEFSEYDGIVSPAYTVLKAKAMLCPDYYKYYFKTSDFISRLNSAVYGIRDGKQIGFEDFGDLYLHCPPVKEQQKIAEILSQCDKIIDLYQAELEEVKHLKRACLQMMFPKAGEVYPKCRFPGFTAVWKQRKVNEVCSISTGKSNTQDKTDEGIYPFYVRSPIIEKSNRYLYDEEAVLTVGDGAGTGKVFHYVNGKYDLHQRVYRLFDFASDVCAKFFFHWLSEKFYERVMSMTAKTSVDSVRLEMIAEMDFVAPSFKEQQQISEFLDSLDDLITLHQRKLNAMQLKKKALMQLLLTGIVRVNT